MTINPNGVATIDGDSHHGVWCRTEGLVHDKWMANIIQDLIRKHNVKVCVDAGANIGTLTRPMLDMGCEVHAFEPNPEAVKCLRHNCPEVHCYECGLSDKPGYVKFAKLPNAGASYIQPMPLAFAAPSDAWVQISMLDGFRVERLDFIKLDIEGSELAALRGSDATIKANRPIIICEVNTGALERAGTTDADLLKWFIEHDYETRVLQPDCKWGDPQFDILAVPREKL